MFKHETQKKDKVVSLFGGKVPAGLPSSLQVYQEEQIYLADYLIKDPESTFLVRVHGDSMIDAGIFSNDLLVVDSHVRSQAGKIVIAIVDGELTVKRLLLKEDIIVLKPENPNYQPIYLTDNTSLVIAGVVIHVIHTL